MEVCVCVRERESRKDEEKLRAGIRWKKNREYVREREQMRWGC